MRKLVLSIGAALVVAACSDGEAAQDAGNGDGGGTGRVNGYYPECEERTLSSQRTAPDMLIVLDRSTSMVENDYGADRWSGSRDAVNTLVGELEDRVRFGLMTFPGGGGGGGFGGFGGGAVCGAGQLDEPIQIRNAAPIASTLGRMRASGYTPTAQTLQEVLRVLEEAKQDVPATVEFTLPQYVLLVTDGDPNCFNDGVDTGDPEAQQASIDAVAALTQAGAVTYVIGYQTGSTTFAPVLDAMAAQGNSGQTTHRSVDSGEALLEEFRRIAGSAVTCDFVLSQPADIQRVEIYLNGELVEYDGRGGGRDGWTLSADERTVHLHGATCDALQTGSAVTARVSCDLVRID